MWWHLGFLFWSIFWVFKVFPRKSRFSFQIKTKKWKTKTKSPEEFQFLLAWGVSIFVVWSFLGFQLFWVSSFWTWGVFNSCCLNFSGFLVFGHEKFQFLLFELFWIFNFSGFLVFGHEEQEIWFDLFERCWVRLGVLIFI